MLQREADATEKQMSRVESQQSLLDTNINALHEAIAFLEDRLRPVLSLPQPTPSAPSKGNPIRALSLTVSERLSEASENVCRAHNRVAEITGRLEI